MHWEIPLAIFSTHTLIDRINVTISGRTTTLAFVIDQLAHVGVTLLTAVIVVRYGKGLSLYWAQLFGPPFVKTVVFVAGAVATAQYSAFS